MTDVQGKLQHLFNPRWQRWVRFDIAGLEHYPRTGPVILAGNHRSYFDFFVLAQLVRRGGRPIRMMAKKELFDVPVVGRICHAMGGIPVDRHSTRAIESYAAAIVALEAGEVVGMMPQGTIPRGAAFRGPVLKGKTGVARLAEASGAPVIPFGLWGTDVIWPREAKGPRIGPRHWRRPVTVRVRIGPPVQLPGGGAVADTAAIMAAIMDLLPPSSPLPPLPPP
jgi:putative phosphoserine phosphatase/1-acylglycerol-3-phosphate O-acyltransferase